MPEEPRLVPWNLSPGLDPTDNRDAIITEVKSGLRNERDRIAEAAENQAFFDLCGQDFVPRREAETEFDYSGRPKRVSGFCRQAISRLCQHTYNPGPSRSASDAPAADKLLQTVYEQCHIDMVMNEAERLSTINNVACIQIVATGDEEQPIDLQLWGSDEFAVFLSPDDPRKPLAVVLIDKFDAHIRYRLWFPDLVYTFSTKKLERDETTGGVEAVQIGDATPNPYGCLPFSFVHYEAPVRRFWTPCPGTFVRSAEDSVNDRLSKIAEGLDKFFGPISLFINVSPEFNPEVGPGRFLRLMRSSNYDGDGFEGSGDPDAKYLQAELAVEQAWHDLREFMGQISEAVDLPANALRLDYQDAPSGISLIIKTFPLLSRARQRRPIFQFAETQLARTVCQCVGNFYRQSDLLAASKQLRMLLSWPEPNIPIPGQERDDSDSWELAQRTKSRVMVVAQRYGLNRDQALDHLKKVEEDEAAANALLPPPEERQPINAPPQLQEGKDGDEKEDDEDNEDDE
jgi:hypothetical protein